MPGFYAVDKKTGTKVAKDGLSFNLEGSKVLIMETQRDNVVSMERNGNHLLIKLKTGEVVRVEDFFELHDGQSSSLVINDTTVEGGGYWLIENPEIGENWSQLNDLSSTMSTPTDASGIEPWMYWVGAGLSLGMIGGIAASTGGGSGSHFVAVDEGVTKITTPKVLTNNKMGITGTGTVGSEIVLTKPDGSTEIAVVDKDGKWSFTYGGNPLQDGEEATVYARDPKNPSNRTDEVSTTADTVIPDAPIITQNNGTSLSGEAEAGSKIVLTKDDGTTATTTTDKDGNWSFKPNPITDGKGGDVVAIDSAGNTSPTTETGNADKVAPDAPIIDTNDVSGLSGIAEAGSTVTLTKSDNTTVTVVTGADGKWSFKPNPLDNGEKGEFTASDKAGNISDSSSSTASIVGPRHPFVTENNSTSLSGLADPNAEIILKKADGSTVTTVADENGKWSFEPNPLENEQNGNLTSKDNTGESSLVNTGDADKIAPNSPIVSQNNKAALAGDSEVGAIITLTKNDGSALTTVADSSGKWSFRPNPLDNGDSGTVHATDPAGNVGEGITTGVANTLAPEVPVVEINNAAALSGAATAYTTITLTRTDGSVLTTTTDADGKWAFEPNPLSNGRSGEITVTNDFGNQSDVASTGIADKIAPDAPVITTNDASSLMGKSEANATITLSKPDGSTMTTVAESNGQWSFKPNPLDNGENGTLTATDKAGNKSESVITGIADTELQSSIIDANDNTALMGQSETNATISLTKTEHSILTTKSDSGGNGSFVSNSLTNDDKDQLVASDVADNVSSTSSETASIQSVESLVYNSISVAAQHYLIESSAVVHTDTDEISALSKTTNTTVNDSLESKTDIEFSVENILNTNDSMSGIGSQVQDKLVLQQDYMEKAIVDEGKYQDFISMKYQDLQWLEVEQVLLDQPNVKEYDGISNEQMHTLLSMNQTSYQQKNQELNAGKINSYTIDLNLSETQNSCLFYNDDQHGEINDINLDDIASIARTSDKISTAAINDPYSQNLNHEFFDVIYIKGADSDLLETLLIAQQNF